MSVKNSRADAWLVDTPGDVDAVVKELGKNLNQEIVSRMFGFYRAQLAGLSNAEIAVTKDLTYGTHERHKLDVHVARSVASGADLPVVIFFHGGGLISGHKNLEDDLIWANIANFFAANGMVGVNATYRLAPEAKWPAGAEDVAAATAWVRAHIAEFGGDPSRVYLMGHSAGATHVAAYALVPQLHGPGGPGCAGIILVSGTYGVELENTPANRVAYYGDDPSKYAAMQTLGNVGRSDFPVFILIAEYDPFHFRQLALELANELASRHGRTPRIKLLLGHNHMTEVYAVGTGDRAIEPELLDFIRNSSIETPFV